MHQEINEYLSKKRLKKGKNLNFLKNNVQNLHVQNFF